LSFFFLSILINVPFSKATKRTKGVVSHRAIDARFLHLSPFLLSFLLFFFYKLGKQKHHVNLVIVVPRPFSRSWWFLINVCAAID
jgi:hypothetical protein